MIVRRTVHAGYFCAGYFYAVTNDDNNDTVDR